MLAARYYPPDAVRVEEMPRPEPRDGEILIRVEVCGLCGSDVAKYVHQTGAPGEVFGHEVAGTVEAISTPSPADAAAPRFKPGDRVVVAHHAPCFQCHYCRHGNHSMCPTFKSSNLRPGGFGEYLIASPAHVAHTAFALPPGLSAAAATFMEPLACALKALPRLNLQAGDVALVYGLGPMGMLFARLLAASASARVVGIDPIERRRRFAGSTAQAVFAPDDPALAAWLDSATEGRGADAAVLVAGRGAVAADAMRRLRPGAAACLFAASPDESAVGLPLNLMYYSEVMLFGSYSPEPEGFSRALSLLAEGVVRVEDLVSHRLPLEQTARAFEMARRGEGMKILIEASGG